MSKYNNMKSIPIDSLTLDELRVAVKEWSEGNESLEKLLWCCKNNNVETMGCHVSKVSYLEICINDSEKEILKLMDVTFKKDDFQIILNPDGGNPFSGAEWYKPSFTFVTRVSNLEENDIYFDELRNELENKEKFINNEFYSKILNLHKFFIEKESCLSFKIKYSKQQGYSFLITVYKRNKDFNYFNTLFTEAGLTLEDTNIDERKLWKIEIKDKREFEEKTKNIISHIINKFALKKPTEENEIDNLFSLALFKKRKFGESEEGKKQLNEWIEKEFEKQNIKKEL